MEVQWKITSQEISWEVIENTTNVKLWPPLSSPLAHMQTYLHVQAHTYTQRDNEGEIETLPTNNS